ncbi:MAG: hypothetical protein HY597_03010, partial [Candidatus Omnitrophica bacterium]|nr:hypothetical protein [Candidatus Omnitrophota bacterium]
MQRLLSGLLIAVSLLWPSAVAADEAPPAPRVEIRDGWFYVDGERFLIKGVGYSPWRPGTLPWRQRVGSGLMARDFERIRDAGFNTLRTWSPLTPDELALADRYGLMVIQGIWIDQYRDYTSPNYQEAVQAVIRDEVRKFQGRSNVLLVLVGNELPLERVYAAGVEATEQLLRTMREAVRQADPTRYVSFANWPELAGLDHSFWDAVCFNLYTYSPSSIAHSLGYYGYVRHLKRTHAAAKPLIITEFGLSVSKSHPKDRPGYGGNSPEEQRRGVVAMWDDLLQAGASGGCVFEWNDEWWKNYDRPNDEATHDDDPEEWFGLVAMERSDDTEGTPRPVYEALKRYNQAVLLSPAEGTAPADQPLLLYGDDHVTEVKFRWDKGAWQAAKRLSRHWWEGRWDLRPGRPLGGRLQVRAQDGRGRRVGTITRLVQLQPAAMVPHEPQVEIRTEQTRYVVDRAMLPVKFEIEVRDAHGAPLANQLVSYAIAEPQVHETITDAQPTDAAGKIPVIYLIREPGFVSISAGTAVAGSPAGHRTGDETFLIVKQSRMAMGHAPRPPETKAADAAKAFIDRLMATAQGPPFALFDSGTELPVQYTKYGRFEGVGTTAYRYVVSDEAGLAAAVGEGIAPNELSMYRDPAYREMEKQGALAGNHWEFVLQTEDQQRGFYKWALAPEEPGVRQYYAALALERAGHIAHAIKAYNAIVVHFPTSIGWTYWKTPWYVGRAAIDKIHYLTRSHPELGLKLVGARILIEHGYDNAVENDVVLVDPGRLIKVPPRQVVDAPEDLTEQPIIKTVGGSHVQLVQFANGHWQLRLDGQPFVVRAVTYAPTPTGQSPDDGTLADWMRADVNDNNRNDSLEDSWVDLNRNNAQEPNEPVVGDRRLLRAMGANTLRLFHHGAGRPSVNKALLRALYEQDRFMVLMGDFVGMDTVGSGANWEQGTDYLNPEQRRNMFNSVKQMVEEFKDEPYILMWVLGNENNYGGVHGIVGGKGNAAQHPKEYYTFVNDLATWIHKEDPERPVAIANGDVVFLDVMAPLIPAVDILGTN